MSVLYLLLPVALIFAAFFVLLFVRSVKHGQFDDLETPPLRILYDSLPPKKKRDQK